MKPKLEESDWSSSSDEEIDDFAEYCSNRQLSEYDHGEGVHQVTTASAHHTDASSSPPIPLRSRRGRHMSYSRTADVLSADSAITAYSSALLKRGYRESISTNANNVLDSNGAGSGGVQIPEETRQRHHESKKRMEIAEMTQHLLWKAYEVNIATEDMSLWLNACVIPLCWRHQILAYLDPIHRQMLFCQERLVQGWPLLHPPFDSANLAEYEQRLQLCTKSVELLEKAIIETQSKAIEGERQAACGFIQIWYRKQLAQRGFYTNVLKISHHYRGLIPGMFDSIPKQSKLTIHRSNNEVTLEYPTSNHARYNFKE